VLQLLREDLGIPVEERLIDRTELYIADEAFSCGTGYQVAAVTRVDYRDVGTGKLGPITRSLRDLYFDLVRGKIAKYSDWLAPCMPACPSHRLRPRPARSRHQKTRRPRIAAGASCFWSTRR
jgi:branched-chain amino acid aminotransferase